MPAEKGQIALFVRMEEAELDDGVEDDFVVVDTVFVVPDEEDDAKYLFPTIDSRTDITTTMDIATVPNAPIRN